MHQLLKKLLILNGYMEEAGGGSGAGGVAAGAGEGDPAGGTGEAGSELPDQGNAGAGDDAGGEGGGAGDAGGEGGGEGGGTPPVKKEDPVAKRFSTVTKERDEAIRRDNESREQLRVALEALDRATGGSKKTVEDPAKKTPVEEELVPPEFIDPEQYQRDMADYTNKVAERAASRAVKAADADRQREAAEASARTQQQQHAQAWNQRRQKAIERLPDYEVVAENPEIAISPAMAMGISSSDNGPDVAYYLGSNPEEATRIYALPPMLQLIELGKLEAKLTAPKTPQVTKVPPPIKPSVGNGEPQVKTVDEMSMDEYAAKRNRR